MLCPDSLQESARMSLLTTVETNTRALLRDTHHPHKFHSFQMRNQPKLRCTRLEEGIMPPIAQTQYGVFHPSQLRMFSLDCFRRRARACCSRKNAHSGELSPHTCTIVDRWVLPSGSQVLCSVPLFLQHWLTTANALTRHKVDYSCMLAPVSAHWTVVISSLR